jgi:hypothetical protein
VSVLAFPREDNVGVAILRDKYSPFTAAVEKSSPVAGSEPNKSLLFSAP